MSQTRPIPRHAFHARTDAELRYILLNNLTEDEALKLWVGAAA